jgi:cytoskeleton protein RodZ
MNTETEPTSNPNAEPKERSPGAALRAAREQARMSIEELASRTRLARHTLEALEQDAFDQLLEPVYVRGYYRKCAKVLNMPEQPLIALYEALVGPVQVAAPAKLRLASGGELGSMPRLSARFAILAPLVAVIACVAIWLMRTPGPVNVATEPVTVEVAGSTTDSAAEVPTYTEPAPVLPAESPTPTSQGSDMPSLPATTVEPPAGVAPTVQAPVPATTAVASNAKALALQFNAISWARVEDRTGRSLLSGVIAAGERRILEGEPPYAVFLGNAPGVKVEFGGQTINVAPYVKDNATARFSVPLAGG